MELCHGSFLSIQNVFRISKTVPKCAVSASVGTFLVSLSFVFLFFFIKVKVLIMTIFRRTYSVIFGSHFTTIKTC